MIEGALPRQAARLLEHVAKTGAPLEDRLLDELTAGDLLAGEKTAHGNVREIQAKLDKLIGLEDAKATLERIRTSVVAARLREEAGIDNEPLGLHAVLSGSPGTGKSEFSKIYAEMLAALGVLSKGHVVRATAAALLKDGPERAGHITRKMLEDALGGVFLLDEAYALAIGKDRAAGEQVLTAINEFMEEHRDDLVVLMAGYQEEMLDLLSLNRGLRSRFNVDIPFPDFTDEQLPEIAVKKASDASFELDDDALALVVPHMKEAQSRPGYANARTVRDLIETSILYFSQRIVSLYESTGVRPPANELRRLKIEDVRAASEEILGRATGKETPRA
jgi:Holliday junction resolvasome RuvABC ATP-dependent DNA helicase subunit